MILTRQTRKEQQTQHETLHLHMYGWLRGLSEQSLSSAGTVTFSALSALPALNRCNHTLISACCYTKSWGRRQFSMPRRREAWEELGKNVEIQRHFVRGFPSVSAIFSFQCFPFHVYLRCWYTAGYRAFQSNIFDVI